jgi:hypothetical protein
MANFNIDYLVVAGGGGGARSAFTTAGASGGGGGAGEYLYKTAQTLTAGGSGYTVTVGEGGNAGVSGVSAANGGNSVFIDTALGGGYGGTGNSSTYSPGASGGSGGGSGINGPTVYAGGSSTATSPGLGNAGGASTSASSAYGAGGGGGAGTAGSNGTSSTGGNGGTGVQNSITSTATFYAGGGGGGSFNNNNVGSGGSGVGGNANARAAGSPGTSNTGSGGGGGSYSGSAHTNGASGGSGIVILRYPTADVASYTATGLTPIETTDGTDTILSFTTVGTGTITFAAPAPPITPFDGTKVTTPVTGFNNINTTQGLKLPSGDNSNQPLGAAAEQGMIRNDTEETVNSSASALAHYNGTNWQYFAATESPDPIVYSTFAAWDVGNTISYNGTGNTLYNIVNNPTGFNFTKYGGVSYDGANNSFNFNGATGSAGAYMRFSQSAMNIPNEYTVSMWVNFTAFPTNTTLYAYGYTPSLRQFLSSTQMRYYVTPGPSGNYTPFFNHGMTTGNWYNITMVFTTTTVKTYISQEGNSTATLKQTATTSHGANQNTNDLYFGCNVSNYNSNFNGQLRIMEIYDSQLNQTDIDFIVNQGSQR